jgi:hypothetical protein
MPAWHQERPPVGPLRLPMVRSTPRQSASTEVAASTTLWPLSTVTRPWGESHSGDPVYHLVKLSAHLLFLGASASGCPEWTGSSGSSCGRDGETSMSTQINTSRRGFASMSPEKGGKASGSASRFEKPVLPLGPSEPTLDGVSRAVNGSLTIDAQRHPRGPVGTSRKSYV